MRIRSTRWLLPGPLVVVLLAQLIWSGWFLWRGSFTVGDERVFCLFDDAMISMTYARNLVEGHGLAWARWGEPVEGFTHPLWVGLMVLVHLLPLAREHTSLAVQLVSLVTLLANVVAVAWLVRRHFATARVATYLPAAVATAFYYPLAHWALQGMETGLQALLTTFAVGLALDQSERGERRELALAAVFAGGYLLRMDMLVLAIVVAGFVAARGGFPRLHRRRMLVAAGTFIGCLIGYQVLRQAYFGDPLPNTYYLKLAGIGLEVRWLRGLATLVDNLRPLLLPILAVGLGVAVRARRRPQLLLPAIVLLASWAYSVHVGGDVWEKADLGASRFVAFAMPMLFVLANGLLNELLDAAGSRLVAGRVGETPRRLAVGASVCLLVLWPNGLLPEKSPERWDRFLVLAQPLHAAEHEQFTRQVLALQRSGAVPQRARVAVMWAGIPAYFSDWEMVDILGYNDRATAHAPPTVAIPRRQFRNYQPGHVKLQHERVLRDLRPDFVYQVWGLPKERLAELMARYGYVEADGFWFRRGSRRVHPERLAGYRRLLASYAQP